MKEGPGMRLMDSRDLCEDQITISRFTWTRVLLAVVLFAARYDHLQADEKLSTDQVERTESFGKTLIGSPFRFPVSGGSGVLPIESPRAEFDQQESRDNGVTQVVHQESRDEQLTTEDVVARKTVAEQTSDLKDEDRAAIGRHFQRSLDLLTQKSEAEKTITDWRAEKETVPARIAELRAELSEQLPPSDPSYPENATIAELESLRVADEEVANGARRSLEEWELKAKLRAERRPQMSALIESAHQQLEKAQAVLAAAAPEGELPVITTARQTEQQALVEFLRVQLELLRAEQVRYESMNELFPLQRDVLTRAKNTAEKRAEAWKPILAEARRQDTARQEREARMAREALRNAHPALRELAESNAALTTRRKELQEFIAGSVSTLTEVNATLTSLEKKFRNIADKEKRSGLTTAIGLMLRSQRNHLPVPEQYYAKQQAAEREIVRIQTEQMQMEDERSDLGDIQVQVDETMKQISPDDVQSPELQQMTVELLTDRRKYLDNLLTDYEACLQTLTETDVSCRRLITTIHDYEQYIDERILWVRSAAAVDKDFLSRSLQAAKTIASTADGHALVGFLVLDAVSEWPLYVLFLAALVTSLGLRTRQRRWIAKLGETTRNQFESGIQPTLIATGLTILAASGLPMLMWFIAWRISKADLDAAIPISDVLFFSAGVFWIVNSFRLIFRRNGVAQLCLEWPLSVVKSLHANLLIYLMAGMPLIILVMVTETVNEGRYADSLGRLAFVFLCLLLWFTVRRIIRPSGSVVGPLLRMAPDSLMSRLRYLWYPLATGSPLLLAALALMGYQYTAEQLMIRIQWTLCLSLVLLIGYTMVMQWMLAAKRSLALKQARIRRAAAVAAAQREAEEGGAPTSPVPPTETPLVNLSLLNQQILQLIRGTLGVIFLTVSWGIWSQVLPALQVFSRMELWTVSASVPETGTAAEAGEVIRSVSTGVVPITLGSVLFAAAVLTAAVLASRNLPGLLELAVLQRLPMDHGGRNAITTVSRYLLILSGIVVSCNALGISWGNVQWLAAALTVGLGFGLQEIFANFISGLIILFERPVRIGDVITIDGVSGCVSRIQMRATTITDWDRKEYIVPNKEFVTGKVLNWTLSDKVNRVVINVGAAYGTNTELALQIMQSIADAHPGVLQDPPPVVSFEGFGDSCLNLILRCYLPNLDHRLKITTELHSEIHRRFAEQGIEIPFPQRDLHIRAGTEILNALSPASPSEKRLDSEPVIGTPRPDSRRAS